jgi:hypothetical protein
MEEDIHIMVLIDIGDVIRMGCVKVPALPAIADGDLHMSLRVRYLKTLTQHICELQLTHVWGFPRVPPPTTLGSGV